MSFIWLSVVNLHTDLWTSSRKASRQAFRQAKTVFFILMQIAHYALTLMTRLYQLAINIAHRKTDLLVYEHSSTNYFFILHIAHYTSNFTAHVCLN